jgi:hypothetical protein
MPSRHRNGSRTRNAALSGNLHYHVVVPCTAPGLRAGAAINSLWHSRFFADKDMIVHQESIQSWK